MKVVLDKAALRNQSRGSTKHPRTLVINSDYLQVADLEVDGLGCLHQHERLLTTKNQYVVGVPCKISQTLRLQILQLAVVLAPHFDSLTHPFDRDWLLDYETLLARRQPGLASSIGLFL